MAASRLKSLGPRQLTIFVVYLLATPNRYPEAAFNPVSPDEISNDDEGVFNPDSFDGTKWVGTDYSPVDSDSISIAGRQAMKKCATRKLDPSRHLQLSPPQSLGAM
ncbi:hypothetical protein QBC36DRAFT_294852 [Triangularia setosa]|uniref:Uncharacterized protein n=1 Tax=Triangularia setosa TaxID=2587417 RepID=A0AAN7A2R1_9PEZI|nr:hypothetical protein QBC36DRAFT_294852 [Podospora setosa]